jgi:hypothetical protein
MLAWVGVFGLGASGYYVGRSHPDVLTDLFSVWSLALALLLLVCVRAVLRRPTRRPTIAEWLVFAGFGVAVCSLAQTPSPASQIARLRHPTSAPLFVHTDLERFVARTTTHGEHVAILIKLGHRIAYDVGVRNVAPFANLESMLTIGQLSETVRALRAAHGRKLFLPLERLIQEEVDLLGRDGFVIVRESPKLGVMEMIDHGRAATGGG